MSKSKKIALIISIIVIIVTIIIGIVIYRNQQVDNIVDGENNINQVAENSIKENETTSKNSIESNQVNAEETSNESKVNNIVQTETTEKNKTTQTVSKGEDSKKETQKQTEQQGSTIVQEKPKQEQQPTPQKPQEQITQDDKKDEQITTPVVERCTTNDNHAVKVGNYGKWFDTQAGAVSVFESEKVKWENKWTNNEIDDDTFFKKCPDDYEVYSCYYCNKWTINISYD